MSQNTDKNIPSGATPDGKNALQQEGIQVAKVAASQAAAAAGEKVSDHWWKILGHFLSHAGFEWRL